MMQRWRITFPPNIITVIEMGDDRIANGYLIRPPFAKWTTIQRFIIISSCSLWKFSQWEKREYNEQRLKSFNVVHSFLNNRQKRKKKDTVEFQAENNKLIIGSRGIDRISRWAPPCELKNSRRVSVNGTKTPRGGRWWLLYGRTRDERRS